MATISYTEMFVGFVCLILLYHWFRDRNSVFINWPIIGGLPELLGNLRHLHHYLSKCLDQTGGTFEFRGPWFCNVDFLVTCDPLNVNHILSKHSSNYTKGPDFANIFEPLGEGIIVAESDSWRFQRKMIHSYLKSTKFQLFLERTIQEKVSNGLFPVLDRVCISGKEVNLEDILLRLGFDMVCSLFLGCDPKYLSLDLPQVPCDKALHDMEEAVMHRHVLPKKSWRLLKWLHIGPEKKHSEGLKIFDDFVYKCIESKREENEMVESFDFLTACLTEEEEAKYDVKFLRDVLTNLVIAGRDTSSVALSWFFYLLATHRSVEAKILEEIKENLMPKEDVNKKEHIFFSGEELDKLVYLQATLYETLRLYPSVPLNLKCSVLRDTLPSGHRVNENTKIFIFFYAMGRMKNIWGEDCCEFKPERWIGEDGGIVHVPSYKFTAFSAGPRTCLGKDLSLVQMKIVAAAIILNYKIGLAEDHGPVVPSSSVVLHMKHSLRVRVTKRSV